MHLHVQSYKMSSADDHADNNNNVKHPIEVIESEQKYNGDDLAGSSDNLKEIFNHILELSARPDQMYGRCLVFIKKKNPDHLPKTI